MCSCCCCCASLCCYLRGTSPRPPQTPSLTPDYGIILLTIKLIKSLLCVSGVSLISEQLRHKPGCVTTDGPTVTPGDLVPPPPLTPWPCLLFCKYHVYKYGIPANIDSGLTTPTTAESGGVQSKLTAVARFNMISPPCLFSKAGSQVITTLFIQ